MPTTNNTPAPSACTSPGADAGPFTATPAAGVQTERAMISARALPTDYSRPEQVEVTIAGVAHVVDVGCDRDDWQLPDCDDAIAHLVIDAIDAAIERELARDEYPATRLERTWARRAA